MRNFCRAFVLAIVCGVAACSGSNGSGNSAGSGNTPGGSGGGTGGGTGTGTGGGGTGTGGSGGDGGDGGDGGGTVVTPSCTTPMPASASDGALVIATPSDTDASASPSPTTTIHYSILTPPRCAGDRFPLVLHSHGYGGKRLRALAADGTLMPDELHFESINKLAQALPYHGYVVISFDQRGHGESTDSNARIIDPAVETQDARALLDWAYDNADAYGIQREDGSGIARDIKVGTLGYSYGGAFQLPLAALDARIDAIVPNGTWHGLLYSLLPGDSMKIGFGGLLCLLATTGGVSNTPLVQTMCNAIGIQGLGAYNIRSRDDLAAAAASPLARPRQVTEDELIGFFQTHGMNYFRERERAGQPWGFGETQARLRPVPALFLQGNRDVLFNLTEAYWNQRYFLEAGADARLISTEGGHMNPLANQVEGTANCGGVIGVEAILGWFDHYLKNQASSAYDALPKVCISIADTTGTPDVTPRGLVLERFPVGSLSGAGAVPARLDTASAAVPILSIVPSFVPVASIVGDGQVLAGVPTISRLNVMRALGALPTQSTNAFVGVGIVRGGKTILVDDQLTPFTEGEHTDNRGIAEDDRILLPAIGERLLDGDRVGLLFYPQHVQYGAIVSAEGLSGLTGIVTFVSGVPVPPVTSALEPLLGLLYVNPYNVEVSGVELPILVPGTYAGSRLSE